MVDFDDRLWRERLVNDEPYVMDDGFTADVLGSLPRSPRRRRTWILLSFVVVATLWVASSASLMHLFGAVLDQRAAVEMRIGSVAALVALAWSCVVLATETS